MLFLSSVILSSQIILFTCISVIGLEFDDDGMPQEALVQYYINIAKDAHARKGYVAYKEGHLEKDILVNIGYGHLAFNLEDMGCPKFEILLKEHPLWRNEVHDCGRHSKVMDPHTYNVKTAHCPAVEVYCFWKYLQSI